MLLNGREDRRHQRRYKEPCGRWFGMLSQMPPSLREYSGYVARDELAGEPGLQEKSRRGESEAKQTAGTAIVTPPQKNVLG